MGGPEALYRLHPVHATEEHATVIAVPATSGTESRRLAEAHERAAQRVSRQRDTLRPLGWAVIAVVATGAASAAPAPGLHGRALGVTLALVAFAGTLAVVIRDRFTERGDGFQAAVIAAMGAAGVALVALQSQGANELAAGAAVWMAVARLPRAFGIAIGVGTAAALDTAAALSGSSSSAILAATVLLALLGLVAYFIKQARASQDRTELLLAQLEDAREEQTRAAAIAERSRIASELHDVLAHSLSGAAIQLQAARKLAEREQAAPSLHTAIDRAGQLVRDGLANARQAVGALRGEELPGVAELESLIASFRDDMDVDVTVSTEGTPRTLPADAGLALYRGAQEALTNIARYSPGATTMVVLRYTQNQTTLIVEDRDAVSPSPIREGLKDVGGGRGLAGLRERVERVGGSLEAGPTESGWRVEVVVPS
jgi:signal transduction histidine kinase